MKTPTSTLIILLICTNFLFAQDPRKGYIGIALGTSIPSGDYASKNASNSSAGLAKTGILLEADFGYKLTEHWGVCGVLRRIANSVDNDAIATKLQNQTGNNWNITTRAWVTGNFLLGGFGSIPVNSGKTFLIEPKAMIGFTKAISPTIKATNSADTIEQQSITAGAFAYLLGVSARCHVSNTIDLILGVDYLATKPEFKNVVTYSSVGGSTTENISQKMNTINVSITVGFRL